MEQVTSWESDPWGFGLHAHLRPGPTLLNHVAYNASDRYPDKDADIVGYWAENRVLGGVVIFDRSESWGDDDEGRPEPNVYLHSDRSGVTFRVWQLLDEQQQALVHFLTSPAAAGTGPFPLSASEKNLKRFDPGIATRHKVYRDIWERAETVETGCVRNALDYPEIALGWLTRQSQ